MKLVVKMCEETWGNLKLPCLFYKNMGFIMREVNIPLRFLSRLCCDSTTQRLEIGWYLKGNTHYNTMVAITFKPQFYHKSWGTSATIPENACYLKSRSLNHSRREWIVVYEQLYVLVFFVYKQLWDESTACEKLIWNHIRTVWSYVRVECMDVIGYIYLLTPPIVVRIRV